MERAVKMLRYLKKTFVSILVALIALVMSGCGESDTVRVSYTPYKQQESRSATVADNDNYSLLWDDNEKCVLLNDKKTGKVWSSIPYDFYQQGVSEGVARVKLCSPLIIEYYETSSFQVKTANAYSECISEDTVTAQKLKNGIRVTYYFERLEISIPVDYVIDDYGMEARVRVNDIGEKENLVTKISVNPYFASAAGNSDSYLVIPSGGGALMYTDTGSRNVRSWSGAVYGEDYNRNENEEIENSETVCLPFFGVSDRGSALLAVLDKGKETALVEAQAGDSEIGYSSVWASFVIRGYDYISTQNMHGVSSIVLRYPYERLDIDYCSVKYMPIAGENAGYNEIAETYAERFVNKTGSSEPRLYIKLLGAIQQKKLIMGIPTNELVSLTTIEQADEILSELLEYSDNSAAVQLLGYGTSGLNIGDVGGGFKIPSSLGSKKDFEELSEKLSEKNVKLYWDFDLVRFSGSSSGFSYYSDSVRTPNKLAFNKTGYLIENYNKNVDKTYRLLARNQLLTAADKMIAAAEKYGACGVSVSSLSSGAYSDYNSTEYFSKNGIASQVEQIVKKLSDKKLCFAADGGNSYAADLSDCVFGSPMNSGLEDAADEYIPLYQMVYKGRVPVSGTPINLSIEPRTSFLKAVSTGSGLCFTVCGDYEGSISDNDNNASGYSKYSMISDEIKEYLSKASDLLDSVEGATIAKYSVITEDVRLTEFSNGIGVLVNFSDSDYKYGDKTAPANGFIAIGVNN